MLITFHEMKAKAIVIITVILGIFLMTTFYLYGNIHSIDSKAFYPFDASSEKQFVVEEIEITIVNKMKSDVAVYFEDGESGILLTTLHTNEETVLGATTGQKLYATSILHDDRLSDFVVLSGRHRYTLEPKLEPVVLNYEQRGNRTHPVVLPLGETPTTAVYAKFRSLSSRSIQLWFDDGRGGILQGTLSMGQETTTNAYEGHRFFATPVNKKDDKICKFTVSKDKVLYPIFDEEHPASDKVLTLHKKETAFMDEYFNRTGILWCHHFDEHGPRPPPVLNMWPAGAVGDVHRILTTSGKWNCSESAAKCQGEPFSLDLEVISLRPRAFVIDNFLSDFEADEIIYLSSAHLRRSIVGDNSAGIFTSNTRTSRNTWLERGKSSITNAIFVRAAHVLGIDEKLIDSNVNAEMMQVVSYEHGQKYDPHHDWGVNGHPESRFITLLLYLNDMSVRSGGATSFPKADGGKGIKVIPKKGTAVLFYNLLPDGNGDDLSLHSSMAVLEGKKMLANFWVWDPKK